MDTSWPSHLTNLATPNKLSCSIYTISKEDNQNLGLKSGDTNDRM